MSLWREYLAVSPAGASALPEDAPRLLTAPDMFSISPQQLHERPTVAFLDHIHNCPANAANMHRAALHAFAHSPRHFAHATMMVGAPGLSELYLPGILTPLEALTALGGTSAQLAGALGNKYIMMVFSNGPRPALLPAWHEDAGKTYGAVVD